MTVAEVAKELRVSNVTVLRYISARELLASRIGREYRIAPAALDAFLAHRSNAVLQAVDTTPAPATQVDFA